MSWSAAQYVKFEEERTRPVRDLVQRIPNHGVERAADIGCGPGNSTEVLRERYLDAAIVGIDSSPDMIDAARKRLPHVDFKIDDIAGWDETGFDVILADAVIQWDSRPRGAAAGADRRARAGRLARGPDAG